MNKNPLKVVTTDQKNCDATPKRKGSSRERTQAKFDRLWLQEPERFDLSKSARELNRLDRTLDLIKETISPSGKQVVDLGCGSGFMSRMLRDAGGTVDAVDVSQIALKHLKEHDCEKITPINDYIPDSKLADSHYDIVVATELIADLDTNQYRIFFSELVRIVDSEGYVVCSTPIDIQSEDALQQFAGLATTEIDIHKWVFSYHYLQIKFLDFFKAPSRFVKGSKNKQYREKSLEKRYSLTKWWFKINSTKPLCYIWTVIKPIMSPFCKLLENSKCILMNLEKLTKFFWKDSAISHAIFIGKRKPIIPPTEKQFQPKEMKHKKQVWE
jgi:2-polyprenyl-3-methyl-5-hydroxy-6-metoxy-1,4-benzoquinol methylase